MTDPSGSVEALLAALRAESSLPGRVRLLAQSWKQIRALGPTDRHRLALGLGSKWAWKHLERTFEADGELSEGEMLVKRALRQVGESDPSDVRETVRLVRSGQHKEAGSRFLQLLEAAVVLPTHEEEEQEEQDESGADAESTARDEDAEPGPAPSDPEDARSGARAPGESDSDEAVADSAAADTRAAADGTGLAAASATRPAADEDHPSAARSEARRGRPTPAKSSSVAAAGVAARSRATRKAPPSRTAPPPPGEPEVVAVEDPLAAMRALELGLRDPSAGVGGVAALRLLRRLDLEGAQIASDSEQRRSIVARVGTGWAARRALTQMIEGGLLTDVDEALALIAGIESPAQQTWALADLIAFLDLDQPQVERVLAAAPTEAARRRLALRAAR